VNILGRLLSTKVVEDDRVLDFRSFKFKVGDQVLVWKVIQRESDEILLKWEVGQASGTTWFYIPRDENVLVFGSSILLPKELSGRENLFNIISNNLYLHPGKNLPQEQSIGGKLGKILQRTAFDFMLYFHRIYSKYLLLSTYNKITAEKK